MKPSGEISALTALAIVACVGIGAYAWLTFTREGPPAWVKDPGVARGAVHVGTYVVLIDSVSSEEGSKTTHRLTVVDATSGKRLKALDEPDLVGCRAATPNRMWCLAGGLELLDLPSLEPALSVAGAIIAGNHGVPAAGAWMLEGTTVYQQLTSGKAVTIDPTTLAITPAAAMPTPRKNITEPDTSCERLRGAWTAALARNACESVAVHGGIHVVTTTSPAERVLGIEQGTVRWTTGLP